MFLVVTLFSILLGREAWVVRERTAMRKWLEENDGNASPTMQFSDADIKPISFEQINTLPFWRRWLGDESISTVRFPVSPAPPEHVERAKRLFPEAKITKLARLQRR
jgi:hypothetical protein